MRTKSASLLVLVPMLAVVGACGAPRITDIGASSSPTPDSSGTPAPTGTATPIGDSLCSGGGTVGNSGGTLPCLSFAIVGDTRPAAINDTSGYPTSIITKIYQDLEHEPNGRPPFAIATGDYAFASTSSNEAATQVGYYLTAQQSYSGTVYHAMGNHECTGATDSNCASASSSNHDFSTFMSKMMSPLGLSKPYFTETFTAADGSWTAKFVFIAANAWDSTQATWLKNELAKPTTYTFVVRHEGNNATTAPGVTPSNQIIAQYPYTLLLVGHTHTFEWNPSEREVVTGIGGAPLTGSLDYGYVIARQRGDGAIDFSVVDYQSGAVQKHFVVTKDGATTN